MQPLPEAMWAVRWHWLLPNGLELKDVTVSLLRRLGDIRRYDILQEIKPLNDFKDDIREFFDLVLFWYRDVLLYKAAGSEEQLIFREQALEIRLSGREKHLPWPAADFRSNRDSGPTVRANVNFDLTMELLAMTIKENIG